MHKTRHCGHFPHHGLGKLHIFFKHTMLLKKENAQCTYMLSQERGSSHTVLSSSLMTTLFSLPSSSLDPTKYCR